MTKKDRRRLAEIKKRIERADIQPLRARRVKYGWEVVQPYAAFNRHDVVYAWGLDGDTAAFMACAPDDIRWLVTKLEETK